MDLSSRWIWAVCGTELVSAPVGGRRHDDPVGQHDQTKQPAGGDEPRRRAHCAGPARGARSELNAPGRRYAGGRRPYQDHTSGHAVGNSARDRGSNEPLSRLDKPACSGRLAAGGYQRPGPRPGHRRGPSWLAQAAGYLTRVYLLPLPRGGHSCSVWRAVEPRGLRLAVRPARRAAHPTLAHRGALPPAHGSGPARYAPATKAASRAGSRGQAEAGAPPALTI